MDKQSFVQFYLAYNTGHLKVRLFKSIKDEIIFDTLIENIENITVQINCVIPLLEQGLDSVQSFEKYLDTDLKQ